MKKLKLFGLAVIFCFTTQVWAQEEAGPEKDYAVFDLGKLLVIGEKSVISQVGIINVVTAEEIQAHSAHTVAEALSYVPGLIVATGKKNEPIISIHGLGTEKMIIMLDGVPIYETFYGKVDLDQIPTDNIARIEVIKGSSSVLYGPNAMAGVINIVTKKATEKPVAEVTMEFGDYNTQRYSVSHGMKRGIFNYWLNYSHRESDGWRMSDDFTPVVGKLTMGKKVLGTYIFEDGGKRNNSDYVNNNFWCKFGIEPNPDSEYYVNFSYIKSEKGVPPSIEENRHFPKKKDKPAFSNLARFDKYDLWTIDLSARQDLLPWLTLKAKLFYHKMDNVYDSYADPDYKEVMARSSYDDYSIGGSFFTDFKFADWNLLKFGLHFKKDSHKSIADVTEPWENYYSSTGSVGLEDEFTFFKNLSIIGGISYDFYDVDEVKQNTYDKKGNYLGLKEAEKRASENETNFLFGLRYLFPDTTEIHASVGKKTRFPTLYQLYSIYGEPDLVSERSLNTDIGISRSFGTWMRAGLSYFRHDVSDLIVREPVTRINKNIGDVLIQGSEIYAELIPITDLSFRFGYTYTHAENISAHRESDEVQNVSEHKIDADFYYKFAFGTKINLNYTFVSEQYSEVPSATKPGRKLDSYSLVGGRISHNVSKNVELYAALQNIFDLDYMALQGFQGFPSPGRNFLAGLTWKY